jgi:hypothetical protein
MEGRRERAQKMLSRRRNEMMKFSPEKSERGALRRVVQSLERAESELSQLAAPDGTVAIQIDDLRSVIKQMDRMRDTLALGQQFWAERWYGSEPERGSAICAVSRTGGAGELIAYLGGDEKTHAAAGLIVAAHNAALNEFLP